MKYCALLMVAMLAFFDKSFAARNLEFTTLTKDASGAWVYEKVIEAPGNTQAALYNRMKAWVLTNIKSDDKNSQTDDPKQEMIITNPTLAVPDWKDRYVSGQRLNFKLILQFKDGKLKVTVNNITYEGLVASSSIISGPLETIRTEGPLSKRLSKDIDEVMLKFVNALEAAAKSDKKSDW